MARLRVPGSGAVVSCSDRDCPVYFVRSASGETFQQFNQCLDEQTAPPADSSSSLPTSTHPTTIYST